MKKMIALIMIVLGLVIINKNDEQVIIPKEAIRFRVIANSDDETDQNTKMLVRNEIQKHLYNDLSTTTNIDEAREKVNNNIDEYDSIVGETLKTNNSAEKYTINYGLNYFPEKIYKGVKYEEGYYESLVVTLGNGKGNNWWCVLFPPLCLLEAEETEETTEVEYKFFIKELIDKYFN